MPTAVATRPAAAKKTALVQDPKAVAAFAPEKVAVKLGKIGPAVDELFALREEKRGLEAKVAEIEAKYKAIEEQLLEKLATEGTDKASGKKANVSVTSTVVANVVDWVAFEQYVKKTGYFHLFQRRVSDPAFREILERKGSVPGAEAFTKKRLNLRVI